MRSGDMRLETQPERDRPVCKANRAIATRTAFAHGHADLRITGDTHARSAIRGWRLLGLPIGTASRKQRAREDGGKSPFHRDTETPTRAEPLIRTPPDGVDVAGDAAGAAGAVGS